MSDVSVDYSHCVHIVCRWCDGDGWMMANDNSANFCPHCGRELAQAYLFGNNEGVEQ